MNNELNINNFNIKYIQNGQIPDFFNKINGNKKLIYDNSDDFNKNIIFYFDLVNYTGSYQTEVANLLISKDNHIKQVYIGNISNTTEINNILDKLSKVQTTKTGGIHNNCDCNYNNHINNNNSNYISIIQIFILISLITQLYLNNNVNNNVNNDVNQLYNRRHTVIYQYSV